MKTNEKGVCPVCDKTKLEYEAPTFNDDKLSFVWICQDCGCSGQEGYSVTFQTHYDLSLEAIFQRKIQFDDDGEHTEIEINN